MSLWHPAHFSCQCCSWLLSLFLDIVILTVFISMLLPVVVDCQTLCLEFVEVTQASERRKKYWHG